MKAMRTHPASLSIFTATECWKSRTKKRCNTPEKKLLEPASQDDTSTRLRTHRNGGTTASRYGTSDQADTVKSPVRSSTVQLQGKPHRISDDKIDKPTDVLQAVGLPTACFVVMEHPLLEGTLRLGHDFAIAGQGGATGTGADLAFTARVRRLVVR